MPYSVQLGQYSAKSGAHYRPHLDKQPWERENLREITILLYTNVGWDAKRSGGCLRLHPTPMGSAPTHDVEPIAGTWAGAYWARL